MLLEFVKIIASPRHRNAFSGRLSLFACCGLFALAVPFAYAATITVTSTADTAANDGVCTFREAIIAANTNTASGAAAGECAAGVAGLDTITFAIPGAGVQTITTTSGLPTVSERVTIDGYTQPLSSANTNSTASGSNAVILIYLDMSSQTGNGLTVTAGPSTIRGLGINPTRDLGIFLDVGSDGSKIEGIFLGTNAAGTAGMGSGLADGIVVFSSNNVIGGTTPAARNVISGMLEALNIGNSGASNNLVQGNLIGTNAAGTGAIPNVDYGVDLVTPGAANVIGGTAAGARNVISGNGIIGVILEGGPSVVAANLVQGNYIGVDVTGATALPNGKEGVAIAFSSMGNVIGGTVAGAGNVISGNGSNSAFGFANANIDASGSGSPGTLIQGNLIGPNAAGTGAPAGLPAVSTLGIILGTGATAGGTVAGASNVIAFNSGEGVLVLTPALGAAILSNSIHSNARLGIDLGGSVLPAIGDGVTANDGCDGDPGPNTLQNFPVVTSALIAAGNVTISGTLNSTLSTTFRVEFFSSAVCDASGNGEGQTFLGFANVTTDGACNAAFGPLVFAIPPGQTFITSTATDPSNNTSEFSACVTAGGGPPPTGTPTPTPTPTGTTTPTPTNTPAGVPTSTPTPVGPGNGPTVPTLSLGMLLLLGAALALTALLLLRRSR